MLPREGGVILAVDVGDTTMAGGLVDPAGAILSSRAVPTDRLGRAEGVLQNLLELIVLGGGVMEAGEALMEPTLTWARFYAFESAFLRTRIVRSGLTKQSGVLGAAALFLYEEGRTRLR
jgi:predicted NBD/HSP70 family sugar kinase